MKTHVALQRPGGVAQILTKNFPVRASRVDYNIDETGQPKVSDRKWVVRLRSPLAKDVHQFLFIFFSEGSGVQMKKGFVKAHQVLSGAIPLARANFTIWVSRPASALATAKPKAVIR